MAKIRGLEMNKTKPPRDRVFLAMCGWPWLVVCHYNKHDDDFVTANLMIDVDGSAYFENEWVKEDEITSWAEMPSRL